MHPALQTSPPSLVDELDQALENRACCCATRGHDRSITDILQAQSAGSSLAHNLSGPKSPIAECSTTHRTLGVRERTEDP